MNWEDPEEAACPTGLAGTVQALTFSRCCQVGRCRSDLLTCAFISCRPQKIELGATGGASNKDSSTMADMTVEEMAMRANQVTDEVGPPGSPLNFL